MERKGYITNHMEHLDATFAALADPTRRALLTRLMSGEATVSELAEPFAMTQPAISKHLKVLATAGLIIRNRDAQKRPSRLDVAPLLEAGLWLEEFRRFSGPKPGKKDAASTTPTPDKKKKKKDNEKQKKHGKGLK